MTQVLSLFSRADIPIATIPDDLVNRKIVLSYFAASLTFLLFAMLAGMLVSLQFLQAYPFPGIELFSPGRWRMMHTNGVIYGFTANAFLCALHWVVPRLTMRKVLSVRLSWFIFFAWQAIVLATLIGLLAGYAQAVEWGETPTFVDPVVELVLILVAINFLSPIFKVKGPMYVTLWYFVAALIWMVLVYAIGNFLPQYFVGEMASGAINGFVVQDFVGLIVAPLGWGLMYYFVPVIVKKPIWSHGLALAGFWGLQLQAGLLVFFHPLIGMYRFLYVIVVELVVLTVIINFFLTVHGKGITLRRSMPIRWFYIGIVFYFTTSLQRVLSVTLAFEKIVPFTDWVVAHSHLVLFGVFGFWIMGIMVYLIPRLLGAAGWYNPNWNAWHFWFTGIGMLVMFFVLVIAGLIQGYQWRDLAPWETSIMASTPFWLVRTFSGIIIIVGQMFFLNNVLMTWIHRREIVPATSPSGAFQCAISPEH